MSALSLPELQQAFTAALMGEPVALEGAITGNGLEPEARLQIYRNIVFNNLTAALATAYPVVKALVGEDFFDAAAARYVRRRPSHSGKLQDYGAEFSDLLAHMPEAGGLPYLAEVARLEWARQECALAPLEPALEPAALATTAEDERPGLRFCLQSARRHVRSAYPVLDIWMYCQQEREERLDMDAGGQQVLVWRSGTQIAMQAIDSGLETFLLTLGEGATLAKACARALDAAPGFDAGAAINWLFREGIATGCAL